MGESKQSTTENIIKDLLKLYRKLKVSVFYTEESLQLLYEITELEEILEEVEHDTE